MQPKIFLEVILSVGLDVGMGKNEVWDTFSMIPNFEGKCYDLDNIFIIAGITEKAFSPVLGHNYKGHNVGMGLRKKTEHTC